MKVIKLYRKGRLSKPEFYVFVKSIGGDLLLNYPIEVPNCKRHARWLNVEDIVIDWIQEFADGNTLQR